MQYGVTLDKRLMIIVARLRHTISTWKRPQWNFCRRSAV
jgi:hypothetical protein